MARGLWNISTFFILFYFFKEWRQGEKKVNKTRKKGHPGAEVQRVHEIYDAGSKQTAVLLEPDLSGLSLSPPP
jgi:hypothetical protein